MWKLGVLALAVKIKGVAEHSWCEVNMLKFAGHEQKCHCSDREISLAGSEKDISERI